MNGYMPGQGVKKPLNMLEQPLYPDIKKAPPEFKWSKKHWVVDEGQTLLDTESHTQLYENAVLAVSRDHGRDRYGHSSYQEKIAVFRPPLENSYEHYGPLNRLPTKVHKIQPRINPGTAHGGHGTTSFAVQNQTVSDLNKHITDRINSNSWRATFYAPLDMPEDNSVLPDLETTMPLYSASAGCESQVKIDAPKVLKMSEVEKPTVSANAGYNVDYNVPLREQTNTDYEILESNLNPNVSADAGFTPLYTIDGETKLDELSLSEKRPNSSVSSGYTAINTIDGETKLDELVLDSQLDSKLRISNPGSETGYQTRLESYTKPEEHIKLRQNPQISVAAHRKYEYKDTNGFKQNFYFKTKIEPVKSFGSGLNSGTIRVAGVEQPSIKLKYDHMNKSKR